MLFRSETFASLFDRVDIRQALRHYLRSGELPPAQPLARDLNRLFVLLDIPLWSTLESLRGLCSTVLASSSSTPSTTEERARHLEAVELVLRRTLNDLARKQSEADPSDESEGSPSKRSPALPRAKPVSRGFVLHLAREMIATWADSTP